MNCVDDCEYRERLYDAYADLQEALDENAKLRELVAELYRELDAATQYDAGGARGIVSEFADRIKELGVPL